MKLKALAASVAACLTFGLVGNSQAVVYDYCTYDTDTIDTFFAERAVGYIVKAENWNQIQCAVKALENKLGAPPAVGGGGDISGPVSSTLNAIATWGDTTGESLLNTSVIINSDGVLTLPDQDTIGGNMIQVMDNDEATDRSCSEIGLSGLAVFADTTSGSGDAWTWCVSSAWQIQDLSENVLFGVTSSLTSLGNTVVLSDVSYQTCTLKTNSGGTILCGDDLGATGIPFEPSSTDNAIVRWDGVDGEAVQDSGITISDADDMVFPDDDELIFGIPDELAIRYDSVAGVAELDITTALQILDSADADIALIDPAGTYYIQVVDGVEFHDRTDPDTACISLDEGATGGELFHDKNCDHTKDAGENYLGSGGAINHTDLGDIPDSIISGHTGFFDVGATRTITGQIDMTMAAPLLRMTDSDIGAAGDLFTIASNSTLWYIEADTPILSLKSDTDGTFPME
ncbi:MAG: hypothetical protein V3S69_06635, partial [Dehalococcoidales bacterium]